MRNYVFEVWRRVAHRYGFVEWEGPTLESTDLYRRKSGDEIQSQLFCFVDKGERDVSLRPELTPTLARLVTARHRDFKKPLKWFQIGSCFRYEAPQKGRLREFYQLNCDVLGEAGVEADAELIAMGIDMLRSLGLTSEDVAVRISDRRIWTEWMEREKIDPEQTGAFLQIIDKWERERPEKLDEKLAAVGTTRAAVAAFMEEMKGGGSVFAPLLESLKARGLAEFVRIDPGIVRGLAYYTGAVFEFFSLKAGMRAVAGGGRYDGLCSLMSGGSVDMAAAGFGMGDVVLTDLITATPAATARLEAWLAQRFSVDAFIVVADETRRPEALALLQALRNAGLSADYAMAPAKVGKQFQAAENVGARYALIVGTEYPVLKVKHLATRSEVEFSDNAEVFKLLAKDTIPSAHQSAARTEIGNG